MTSVAVDDPHALLAHAHELSERPLAELLDLSDTTCVVTGGVRGIGHAVARRFAAAGAATTIVDGDSQVLDVARELGQQTRAPVRGARCDVRDADGLHEIARAAAAPDRRFVWANCAGIFPSHRIDDLGPDEWSAVLGVDLDGTYFGARAAALAAREIGVGGAVINISSTAGTRAGWPPGIAHYAAAKHGVEGLTKALAVELGPSGVRVVCLAPGTVLTEGLVERFGPPGGDHDPYLRATRKLPIPRPALPDDVARVALFCATDAAAMLTGCTIPVDGGHLAG